MTQSTEEILAERAKTHGEYLTHAQITQDLKTILHTRVGWTCLNQPQKESLDMIAHKIGRILNGNPNYRDHWDDIAGYAKLVADLCP
jgi:hypothetical protein